MPAPKIQMLKNVDALDHNRTWSYKTQIIIRSDDPENILTIKEYLNAAS